MLWKMSPKNRPPWLTGFRSDKEYEAYAEQQERRRQSQEDQEKWSFDGLPTKEELAQVKERVERRWICVVEGHDKYGRILAYVYVQPPEGQQAVMVNAELVRQGLAQVVTYPPTSATRSGLPSFRGKQGRPGTALGRHREHRTHMEGPPPSLIL